MTWSYSSKSAMVYHNRKIWPQKTTGFKWRPSPCPLPSDAIIIELGADRALWERILCRATQTAPSSIFPTIRSPAEATWWRSWSRIHFWRCWGSRSSVFRAGRRGPGGNSCLLHRCKRIYSWWTFDFMKSPTSIPISPNKKILAADSSCEPLFCRQNDS